MSISRRTFPLFAALLTALLIIPAAANAAPVAPDFVKLFDGAQLNQSQPPVKVYVDRDATQVTLYVDGATVPIGSITDTDDISDGLVTFTPTLDNHSHTLAVTQTVDDVESVQTDIRVDVNTAPPTVDYPTDGTLTNNNKYFDVSGALHYSDVAIYVDGQTQPAGKNTSNGHGMAWIQLAEALADGDHTAYAATIDDLGHTGDTHSSVVHFTVETAAPDAPVITSAPEASSTQTTATFAFTSEPGAYFICDLDGNAGMQHSDDCDSPRTYTDLAVGKHTFTVWAIDAAGNGSPASEYTFTVTAPQPTTPTTNATNPATPPLATLTKGKLSSHTLTKKRPVKVSFTSSKPGTVTLTLTRKVKGKTKTAAKVSFKVKAGKGSYTLSTKVAKRNLPKGTYTLSLQTTAGTQLSKSITQQLTVR